jgi:predicted nuclease of predicted toxin-antitoxin system
MKFLIDAHLPPSLKQIFQAAGHDAVHTSDLEGRNLTRDGTLNEISIEQERVVVTKDSDFYHSHLLQGRPWKLLFVRTGNMTLKATKDLFQNQLPAFVEALETCSLVELERRDTWISAQMGAKIDLSDKDAVYGELDKE